MGRGRQKAKNTKIARELKSFSPSVDYNALERELGHPHEDEYAKWAEYADETEDELEGSDDDFVQEPHQKRA